MSNAPPTDAAVRLVHQQADDTGLWFVPQTAAEAYLQRALRALHTAVEASTVASHELTDAAAPLDFAQIARQLLDDDVPNGPSGRDIAEQLRQVWNARGAADIDALDTAMWTRRDADTLKTLDRLPASAAVEREPSMPSKPDRITRDKDETAVVPSGEVRDTPRTR